MSGESGQPSKPFQGPQFGLQNDVLSTYVLGKMLGANPWISQGMNLPTTNDAAPRRNGVVSMGMSNRPLPSTYSAPTQQPQQGGSSNSNYYVPNYGPAPQQTQGVGYQNTIGKVGGVPFDRSQIGNPRNNYGMSGTSSVKYDGASQQQQQSGPIPVMGQSGFLQAGEYIPGQMEAMTTVGGTPAVTTAEQAFSAYNFRNPNANFSQRNPYQFSNTPSINVADTYSPQMDIARRDIVEQGNRSREQLLSDLNKRGMLTSGAVNKEMLLNAQEQDRKLANLSSQYSIEQGRAQLQEDQMRRQMEQERQIQQAAEIFRQQGATDEQAQFLASQNVNIQNAQAGQNLAAYSANLQGQQQRFNQGLSAADLRTRQQGQAFGERLQGRQQATAEEQLANMFRRQPVEDLFKMWQQQSSPMGATQGDAGIMPLLGTLGGAAIGAFA